MNLKRLNPGPIIIKMAKFQDKERILKASRKKQEVTLGNPDKASS